MTTSVVMSDDLCPRDLVGVCDCRLVGWTWGEGWAGVMVTPHPDSMCGIGAAGDGAPSNKVWINLLFALLRVRSCR